jgi:toxin ParE1/3/4
MAFRLTRKALDDLLAIGVYTREHWGRAQARAYLTRLDRRIRQLSENPALGMPCQVPGFLRYREGRHVIYYEIQSVQHVLVVRILHARMQPELHL